jgi:hypothetical protein
VPRKEKLEGTHGRSLRWQISTSGSMQSVCGFLGCYSMEGKLEQPAKGLGRNFLSGSNIRLVDANLQMRTVHDNRRLGV